MDRLSFVIPRRRAKDNHGSVYLYVSLSGKAGRLVAPWKEVGGTFMRDAASSFFVDLPPLQHVSRVAESITLLE